MGQTQSSLLVRHRRALRPPVLAVGVVLFFGSTSTGSPVPPPAADTRQAHPPPTSKNSNYPTIHTTTIGKDAMKPVSTANKINEKDSSSAGCSASTTTTSTTTTSGECKAPASFQTTKKNDMTSSSPLSFQALHSKVASLWQSASATVPSYYLIWSPGATKKLVVSSLWLAVFHVYQDVIFGTLVVLQQSSFLVSNVWMTNGVLPLLSSACCAIQLILNVMGVGCGGFNTYLGPVRPYFLSLLGYLSLVVYPPTSVSSSLVVLGRGIIALLPEVVHLWNTYSTSTSLQSDRMEFIPTQGIQSTVELNVPTMGCVACVNKINASLKQSSPQHVLEWSSWLVPDDKGGKASIKVWAKNDVELQTVIQVVQETIHAAGFPDTTVASIQQQEPSILSTAGDVGAEGMQNSEASARSMMGKNLHHHPSTSSTVQIDLSVPSMSCGGCIADVNAAASQASKLVQSTSSYLLPNSEGGQASILASVSSKQELDAVVLEINKALEANGFEDNELQSMEFVVDNDDEATPKATTIIPPVITAEVTWIIPTMSCDHCIRTIDNAIQDAVPSKHRVEVSSSLGEEGGSTTMKLKDVSSLRELDTILTLAEQAIQNQDFDGLYKSSLGWTLAEGRQESSNSS